MQYHDDFYYRDAYAPKVTLVSVMDKIYEEQFNTWKPKVGR